MNCAAIADELFEAELFGHARGAFTGATGERAGLFEEADRGTLLLDEASELSARAQARLLRAIQEGEIRRVGENFARKIDARLIAATNRSLSAEVAAGRFRRDLFYRVNVVRIVVPPLHERVEDIPALANHFWTHAVTVTGSRASLDRATFAALARYDWPGNVREPQNVLTALAVSAPRRGRAPRCCPPPWLGRPLLAPAGWRTRDEPSSSGSSGPRWPGPVVTAAGLRVISASVGRDLRSCSGGWGFATTRAD